MALISMDEYPPLLDKLHSDTTEKLIQLSNEMRHVEYRTK